MAQSTPQKRILFLAVTSLLGPTALFRTPSACAAAAETPESVSGTPVSSQIRPAVQIEEITVSAQRYAQNLQDVPISIAAISARDIEARSVNGLKDLAQFIPNLTFSNHGTSGDTGAIIYVRGIGQQDSGIEFDPGVGIYVDGIYNGRMQGLDLDLVDAERVEILRGPQGTLFGKNTVGGAVNIVSARPRHEFGGLLELTVGRFERRDVKAVLELPLAPDRLAAKLSFSSRNVDGYARRIDFSGRTLADMGDTDRLSGRLVLEYTPSPDLEFLLSVDATSRRENGNPHTLAAVSTPPLIVALNAQVDPDFGPTFLTGDPFTNYAGGLTKSNLDSNGASLIASRRFGNWTLKSFTAYREVKTAYFTDPDGSPYEILQSYQFTNQDQLSQELLLTGSAFGGRLQSVFGLFYFDESADSSRQTNIVVQVRGPSGANTTLQSNAAESWAVFMHGTYNVTGQFRVSGGLRYIDDRKHVTGLQINPITEATIVPLLTRGDSWSAVTPRLGLEYSWTDDVMTYISAARGFKSGGINSAGANPEAFAPFEPEDVRTYEAGIKSEWLNHRVRLNAAAFYTDYKDMQFRVRQAHPTYGALSFIANAAQAEVKGLEMDLMAAPARGLTLNAGFGYTDAKYTVLRPGSPVTLATRFVETPRLSWSAAGEYTVPIGDAKDLTLRIDYARRGDTHHDLANSPIALQHAYGLLNGRLVLVDTRNDWSLAVFGTNLTNQEYFVAGADFRGSLGWADLQYARPREWGMTFRYSF